MAYEPALPCALVVDDHQGQIGYFYPGMGDPGSFHATCSCGWAGSVWDTGFADLDAPLSEHGFTAEYQDLYAKAGGLRAWNATGPKVKYGRMPQALGELYAHLGLDDTKARARAATQVNAARSALLHGFAEGPGQDPVAAVEALVELKDTYVATVGLSEFLSDAVADERCGLP